PTPSARPPAAPGRPATAGWRGRCSWPAAMGTPESAAEILIEGRVQGVGYRDYARRRASGLGLEGWVANLRDGRVRLWAEGQREQIEALVRALEQGPPLSRVAKVDVRWVAPAGPFAGSAARFPGPGP